MFEPAPSVDATVTSTEVVKEVPQSRAPLAPVSRITDEPAPPPLKLEWPADLVQIETDPDKARAAQQQAREQPAFRARRLRRPVPIEHSDEALIQVETRRRDAPPQFETGAV
jgi:hypothetical protein